jgi:hypothetical protein
MSQQNILLIQDDPSDAKAVSDALNKAAMVQLQIGIAHSQRLRRRGGCTREPRASAATRRRNLRFTCGPSYEETPRKISA